MTPRTLISYARRAAQAAQGLPWEGGAQGEAGPPTAPLQACPTTWGSPDGPSPRAPGAPASAPRCALAVHWEGTPPALERVPQKDPRPRGEGRVRRAVRARSRQGPATPPLRPSP
eukprot:CAMPEP_0175413698 /NCGR_PEP_ID=MMETSP0095-20121207/43285_1 /TAXON_ID=311494 /ORGANISM="Alexandrium monilatum, Strain CCMP3105" /LENGTH=114 /DNA_ID=CAMNT_0016712741 /DNA_START=67 /DNA_END=409 /DNA_ORIENTATION=-